MCFLFSAHSTTASNIDSLLTALGSCQSDTACANIRLALGEAQRKQAPDSAVMHCRHVLGQESLPPAFHVKAYRWLGLALSTADYDSLAIVEYRKGSVLAGQMGDTTSMASLLRKSGVVCIETSQHPEALEAFMEASRLAHMAKAFELEARCLSNAGVAHHYMGNFTESAKAFIAGVECSETHGLPVSAALLLNISTISRELEDWETTMDYSKRALEVALADGNESLARMCYQNIGATYTTWAIMHRRAKA